MHTIPRHFCPSSVPLLRHFCPTVRILTHSDAFVCILVEKVAQVTRTAHRPRNTVAGTRIQPRDDTVEEEGDGEESDEDLDGM